MLGTSSRGGIPSSAIKYTQLTSETDSQRTCLKFQTPKNVRRKLLFLIAIVAVVCIVFLFSCTSCSPNCFTVCSVVGNKPGPYIINLQNESSGVRPIHFGPRIQRLPQCIIIGIRKAGTRALITYLNTHPAVATRNKEAHFFEVDTEYEKGLDYYLSTMPFSYADQITLEKTPAYYTSMLAPERIYRMNSSIRLLLIVRDPVVRLISDYEQLALKSNDRVPLEKIVLNEDGDVNVHYKPVKISLYYKHFPHWLEFFDRSQIHIVDGDKFINEPYPELYKVESFLNIGHIIPPNDFYFNETKGFYCFRGFSSPCLGASKGRPHPFVDPEVIKKLRDFFRPRNKLFYDMVGYDFGWP